MPVATPTQKLFEQTICVPTRKYSCRCNYAMFPNSCTSPLFQNGNQLLRPPRRRSCCTVTRTAALIPNNRVGVVIVDHGSKRTASNAMLDDFVTLYRQQTGADIVEPAHMEIARPSIADAVSRCVEQGATQVVVAPYFLSRGRHIQDDIPALVAEAQAQHADITCIIADPIGVDPMMAQLISTRVQDALAKAPIDR